MTGCGNADAKAALARLAEQGQAIILTHPAQVATVLDGTLEECGRLAAENATCGNGSASSAKRCSRTCRNTADLPQPTNRRHPHDRLQ